jgi:hypothetical protein
LKAVIDHGAVMDAEALDHLWKVGLGDLVGIRCGAQYTTGTFERYTDHDINAGYEGYVREVSQGYYMGISTLLETVGSGVHRLAELFNYRNANLGVCAAARQMASGARVVVLGYRPWDYVGLPGKQNQCRRIVDWIYHDQFPVMYRGLGKAVLFAYNSPTGNAACLFNASEDPLVKPAIVCHGEVTEAIVTRPDGNQETVTNGVSGALTLPDVAPWSECVVRW